MYLLQRTSFSETVSEVIAYGTLSLTNDIARVASQGYRPKKEVCVSIQQHHQNDR